MAHDSEPSKILIDVPPADHDCELAFWSAAVSATAQSPAAQGTQPARARYGDACSPMPLGLRGARLALAELTHD